MNALKSKTSFLLDIRQALWPVLYLSAQLLYWYSPWEPQTITSFDRVMGAATAADVLVSGRTGTALLTLLVVLPVLLALSWLLVSACMGDGRAQPHRRALLPTMQVFSGIGLCEMALVYAKRFGGTEEAWFSWAQVVPLALVLFLLLWCAFRRCLPEKVVTLEPDTVLQLQLCAIPVTFSLQMMVHSSLPTPAVGALVSLAMLLACMLATCFKPSKNVAKALQIAALPLLLCLPLQLFYLELANILNQYGVFIDGNQGWVTGLGLACAAAFIGLFVWKMADPSTRKLKPEEGEGATPRWKKGWYPLLLVSMALLAGQQGLQNYINSDFFERANSAVSISGFLNFGQLPAVETHGAHMFSDYIGGIFWGLVNGDALSASFLQYDGLILALTTLVFFYLLKCCVGEDSALAAALLLPITDIAPGDWYAHISYLPALVLVWLLCSRVSEKKMPGRYVVFWLSAAFAVLYRGDIGLAVGGAAVLVLLVHTVFQKSARCWKWFLLSGAGAGGGLAAFFAVLCLIKGINPFSRLREFLEVMAFSNQDWAYESIGTAGTAGFVWVFLVVPVLVLGLVAAVLFGLHRLQQKPAAPHWLFFTFAAAYFFNFPRTLVRHSLAENIPIYCVSVGIWALALGLWLLWRQRQTLQQGSLGGRVALPMLLLASVVVTGALFDGSLVKGTPLLDKALSNFQEGSIVDFQLVQPDGTVTKSKTVQETVSRAVLPQTMQADYMGLESVLEELLAEDETWLDFTNQSALYAILGRRNPVYVNQSPGLLSGEYSQRMFVEQVEAMADKVPVALLPQQQMPLGLSLDGIQNSLRYYRVAEYIYNHYTPYTTVDGFAIWLRNDREELQTEEDTETDTSQRGFKRKNLSGDGTQITVEDGVLTAVSTDKDPQIHGLESLLAGCQAEEVVLTFYFTSDTTGTLQLFYAERDGEFCEENSTRITVASGSLQQSCTVAIPWKSGMRLRLDPPDKSTLVIRNVTVTLGAGNTRCDYTYAAYGDAHDYVMGDIARLWGECDEARAWENPELENALSALTKGSYTVKEEALGGENGRYVLLQLTAKEEASALLSLSNREGYSKKLAGFHFTVQPGTHTYLVRVSCDSYWYSGLVQSLEITPESGSFTVEKAAILQGD